MSDGLPFARPPPIVFYYVSSVLPFVLLLLWRSIMADRFVHFALLMYPEDSYYLTVMQQLSELDYVGILHDRDFTLDGNEEKPHVHIALKFTNARTVSSLSSYLDLPERFIRPLSRKSRDKLDSGDNADLISFYHYLIHDTFKCATNRNHWHLYDVSELWGTLCDEAKIYLQNSDINNDDILASLIFDFISHFEGYLSYSELLSWVFSKCAWSAYRRASVVWHKLIDEHNSSYRNNNN